MTSKKNRALTSFSIPWIVLGAIAGIGYIVGIFYILIKEKSSERWLGLLYFVGPVGSIIMYFIAKKDNPYLVKVSISLLIGFLIWVVIALILGINPFYQIFGYVHGWLNA